MFVEGFKASKIRKAPIIKGTKQAMVFLPDASKTPPIIGARKKFKTTCHEPINVQRREKGHR